MAMARDRAMHQRCELLPIRGKIALALVLMTCNACSRQDARVVLDVRTGDVAAVSRHLAAGASADTTSRTGWPILVEAAFANHTQVAEQLLQARAQIDLPNPNGFTALHQAAKRGNVVLATALLRQAANIDAQTQDGWTPLHLATLMGHKALAELLIAQGAQVDLLDQSGKSPLMHAVDRKRTEIALLLMQHGANVNQTTEQGLPSFPLLEAVSGEAPDLTLIRALLAAGAVVDATGWRNETPLCRAARLGNSAAAIVLIGAGAEVDAIGSYFQRTPLMFAAANGDAELVDALLKAGATIQGEAGGIFFDALESALTSNQYVILERLLRAGALPSRPTNSGKTVLELAVEADDSQAIRLLSQK